MKIIQENEFKQAISEGIVFVDFYADWCGPCKMVGPILEDFSQKYNGKMEFVKLNVDNANTVARQYGVQSIPTMIIFKDGVEVERQIGFNGPAPLEALIQKHI